MLHLLDLPHLRVQNQRLELISNKPILLLVYLAYQGTWVSRDTLATLLRPEADEATAKHHLRVLINRLKSYPWATVEIEAQRLRWVIDSDVKAFRETIGQANWKQAVKLHQKPFLSDFIIKDAPGFEAWYETERENLLSAYYQACSKYTSELESLGHYQETLPILQQALELDPLAEDRVQRLSRNLYLSGKRKEALDTLNTFRQTLQDELGLEPLPETLQLLETMHQAEPLLLQSVNSGKDRIPLTVLHPPALIGRNKELELLQNSNNIILISGEAGLGKSRLLQEAFPQARWLRCREGLENLPYYPIIEHLKTLPSLAFLGIYQEDIGRLVPDFLTNHTSPSDPETSKLRLLEALARVFEYESTPLVIDDLQWADSATFELLIFLAARGNLKIIGAYRPNENPVFRQARSSLRAFEIPLNPLQQADIYSLLISMMQKDTHPDLFSKWLFERSGGNTFFALETLRYLFEQGVLEQTDSWHTSLDSLSQTYQELHLPPKVAQMIAQRTANLSQAAQRTLQAASVIGQGFQARVLAQITGLSEMAVVDALEEAELAHLIQKNSFSHDLIRQSLYANLPDARRKLLHGLVAQTLQDKIEPSLVASHYFEAEDMPQAINYFYKSAQQDIERGQHQSALRSLKRCTELGLENHPLELDVLLLYGTHLVWQNNALAETISEKAYALAQTKQDAAAQARAVAYLLMAAGYSGNGERTHYYLEKAFFWLKQPLSDSLRLEVLEAIMDTAPRAKAFDKALEALREAKALAPNAATVMAFEAQLHYYQANFLEAKCVFENLIQIHPASVRTLTIENDLGISCVLAGFLSEGKNYLEQSLETWKGITHVEALSNSNLGYTLFLMGHYSEALKYLQLAEKQSQQVGSQTFLADTLYRQAGVYFFCRKIEKADTYLKQALQLMREVDDPYRLAYITATCAVLENQLGQSKKAHAFLAESKRFAQLSSRPLPWIFYHRAAALCKPPSQRLAHIKTLQELAQHHHMLDHLAYGYLLEAEVSNGKIRQELLLKTLLIAKERGFLELHAKTLELLVKHDASYAEEAQEVKARLEAYSQI